MEFLIKAEIKTIEPPRALRPEDNAAGARANFRGAD